MAWKEPRVGWAKLLNPSGLRKGARDCSNRKCYRHRPCKACQNFRERRKPTVEKVLKHPSWKGAQHTTELWRGEEADVIRHPSGATMWLWK